MHDELVLPAEITRLQALVDFHQDVFDHLPMLIGVYTVVSSTEFRIAFANRAYVAASGFPPDHILGMILSEASPTQQVARIARQLHACLERGAPIEIEESFSLPHGTIWFKIVYAPIRDGGEQVTRILTVSENITARKLHELAEQERHAAILEQQAATLAELSTPLLTINETTVVMPLVGAVDTGRIQQIKDTLLSGVAASGVSRVILDITGVPVVDTQVANALLQSAQAIKLLGAESILTGIRPEVAQTLIQLGVDLRAITTRGTLQDGIAYALQR